MGDGDASDLEHYSLARFAVELDNIAVVIPRGARKAHFRSRNIGDPTLPHHLGYEEFDLIVSLQSTAIDRADLDVVLVVLPELYDAAEQPPPKKSRRIGTSVKGGRPGSG